MPSLTHPVLRAVAVQLQRVEALGRARDLRFDVPAQQAVGHEGAFADGQDLHTGQEVNDAFAARRRTAASPCPGGRRPGAGSPAGGTRRWGTESAGATGTGTAPRRTAANIAHVGDEWPVAAPARRERSGGRPTIQSESVARQLIHFPN